MNNTLTPEEWEKQKSVTTTAQSLEPDYRERQLLIHLRGQRKEDKLCPDCSYLVVLNCCRCEGFGGDRPHPESPKETECCFACCSIHKSHTYSSFTNGCPCNCHKGKEEGLPCVEGAGYGKDEFKQLHFYCRYCGEEMYTAGRICPERTFVLVRSTILVSKTS